MVRTTRSRTLLCAALSVALLLLGVLSTGVGHNHSGESSAADHPACASCVAQLSVAVEASQPEPVARPERLPESTVHAAIAVVVAAERALEPARGPPAA